MGRRCSHCGHNGHNSRTCITPKNFLGAGAGAGGVRLFGVQLHTTSPVTVRKSVRMDRLSSCAAAATSSSPSSSSTSLVSIDEATEKDSSNGYLSDALDRRTRERRKGVPWTEEEHGLFLAGLEKLGKGDWRGISRNFVTTRTPTQVASHAQKYFLRQNCLSKKRRRSSLFDVVPNCQRRPPHDQSSHGYMQKETASFSRHSDAVTDLSLNITGHATTEISAIDLNSSSSEEEEGSFSELPSSHSPIYFLRALPQPSSSDQIHRPYAQLSQIDLELSIS